MARRRARRADSPAGSGPRRIRLWAEYGWRPGHDLADLLPLSSGLTARLDAWNEQYESADGQVDDEWLDEGAELARLVQLEAEQAGENIQVIYWHDRSRNPRRGSLRKQEPRS